MKWLRVLAATACLWGLAACGNLVSQSATVYEFEGRQWLVTNYNAVGRGGGLFDQNTSRTVAARRPDGTFEVVARSQYADTEDDPLQEVFINPAIRNVYVGNSEDPVGDLISEIVTGGKKVTEINPNALNYDRENGVYTFEDSARETPRTEEEQEMGY